MTGYLASIMLSYPVQENRSVQMPRPKLTVRCLMVAVAAAGICLGRLAQKRASERLNLEHMCSNSLTNISLGLANYSELHGRFPPPFLVDGRGRRTHSWRIL